MFKFNLFAILLFALICQQLNARQTVHYDGLGTFNDDDFYDAKIRPIKKLPENPEKIDTHFNLYNRHHHDTPIVLKWNDLKQLKSNDLKSRDGIKVIIPGFLSKSNSSTWMSKMKDNFLKLGDYTVILVDWSRGNGLPYSHAATNTLTVGLTLGHVIKNLSQNYHASLNDFHLIGHSLGAHIAGIAGNFNQGKVGHITGLDPAGPYFEGLSFKNARLWHTNAQFVESIHTDSRPLSDLGFGMWETCSHVDIYPNGGKHQPGCDLRQITKIDTEGLIHGFRNLFVCNHFRSHEYYMEIMMHTTNIPAKLFQCDNYEAFEDNKCQDCHSSPERCLVLDLKIKQQYGKLVGKTTGKRYFLITASKSPFIGYQYLIRIIMETNAKKEHIEQHGKANIRIVSVDGKSDEFDFNDSDEIFHYNRSYHHSRASIIEPSKISYIEFFWKHGVEDPKNKYHGKMYIDHIEMIGLDDKNSNSKPISMKFKTKMNGIENLKRGKFEKVNK